ncbi:sulfur carrier protein ThiS [Halobacillus sp. Marseille-Q1614]|uniref:sulfur carrier protein ThiS n=1 Tax=Halobacillus sp. Marseille-Q1614 TaxID=2709134 RepID=UPI0015707BCF|nr:sulfur carrier protein ThiS [Halobacillus sp. Marseille-Q1614]
MKIQINGRQVKMEIEEVSVADVLKFYQVQEKLSVVEHNKEIVKKDAYEKRAVHEGDSLEIIHFVGGG